MDIFTNGSLFDTIRDICKRRLWIGLVPFCVILTMSVSLILPLPRIYTAQALILVEGQQIPKNFVQSTVTMGVGRRLQIISQEVLSRAQLEQLIAQFGLYPDLTQQGLSSEQIATAMRQDIGIQVTGKRKGIGKDTVAFEISYTNRDPQKAMLVANALAQFYIEKNLKVRERQASGTTEFLRTELEEAKKKLEEQERQVTTYKQQHFGELPEQMNANLKTLSVLQQQLDVLANSLAEARTRKHLFVQQQQAAQAEPLLTQNINNPDDAATHLETLRGQLTALRLRFSDKHPDVIRLKLDIAGLEKRLEGWGVRPQARGHNVHHTAADLEIQRLTAEFNTVRNDIAVYQRRIENTPLRQQELLSISRDYETTKKLYASLLSRLDEANLAGSLEQRQKAERFRLLEPAVYPKYPAAPNRQILLLIGLGLSLATAVACMFVWEKLDTSFHQVEDLQTFTQTPVLVSIADIVTPKDLVRQRRLHLLGAMALVVILVGVSGVSRVIATDNESLVRKLIRPANAARLR